MAVFFVKNKILKKNLCHNIHIDTINAYAKYKKKTFNPFLRKMSFTNFQNIPKFKIKLKKNKGHPDLILAQHILRTLPYLKNQVWKVSEKLCHCKFPKNSDKSAQM